MPTSKRPLIPKRRKLNVRVTKGRAKPELPTPGFRDPSADLQLGERASSDVSDARLNARDGVDEYDRQLRWLSVLFLGVLLALAGKLYQLQVVRGQEFFELADRNFIRAEELTPDRGLIMDAWRTTLAENRPVYDVYLTPEIVRYNQDRRDIDPVEALAELLSLSEERRADIRAQVANTARRADILVAQNISRDVLARVLTHEADLPGVFIHTSQQRHYPLDDVAAHLLGYMNEVSPEELEELASLGYHRGDYVGRSGIERSFEALLRGAPGLRREVVDVNGQAENLEVAQELLGAYREVAPVPGKNIELTLDTRLQRVIEDVVADEHSVAVVAVDPRDGSVLAVYSQPGFNPNAWSGRLSREELQEINANPYDPLLNKALYTWAPGSTWKVVSAFAALEEGVFDEETRVRCNGSIEYGGRTFRCHNRAGHGWVDMREALRVSCDVYFYEAGIRLGMDTLADYAHQFGFGQRSGVGVGGERAGLVPTREWHNQNTPGGFVGGFTLGAVIGQDVIQASPLQLAVAYAAIANGGHLYYPRLVDRVTTADGRVVFEYPRRERATLPYAPEHMQIVREGLEAVVANESFDDERLGYVGIAGKTGTAQVASLDTVLRGAEVPWERRDHAWFSAYGPIEEPRISLTVLVEHGGSGGAVAAPLAMEIMDRYLRDVLGLQREIAAAESGDRAALDELLPTPRVSDPGMSDALDISAFELLSRHDRRPPELL